MNKIKFDFYNVIFLIIAGIFTYCYYTNTQNDRFHFINNDELGNVLILDTKSGAVYMTQTGYGRDEPGKITNLANPILK